VSAVPGHGERRHTAHVVVPYGAANASVRARALEWIARLEPSGRIAPGAVVVHGPDWPRRPVPRDAPVLLLRNVGRITRGRRERGLMSSGAPGVYDLDDGLPWDDGNLPGLGRWWKRPFPRSLVADRAARAADRVVVGNEVLAAWAADRCADVRIVPTCVEPSDYRPRHDWQLGDAPTIGWIGSPATEPYLLDVAGPLAEVHRRTGARLEVISGPGTTLPDALAAFARTRAWTPTAPTEIGTWDVGIMPLRDGVYERAKCGYKLLQYAASGVPAVGSPVGVNERLLRDMHGLAPTSSDEWVDALCAVLGESATARGERGRHGLAVAAAHSFATWEDRWFDAVGWAGIG
jgi:hypothetical protein